MKKLAILFTTVFVLAAVGFGITVGVSGVAFTDTSILMGGTPNMGEAFSDSQTFDGSFKDISISVIKAKTSIVVTDAATASVSYTTNRKTADYSAKVEGDTLKITENQNFTFASLFDWFGSDTQLTIELPRKLYNKVRFDSVSGGSDVEGLEAEELEVNTTSGECSFNIFANTIKINTISGDVEFSNCSPEKVCNALQLTSTSGGYKIEGFKTESYVISSVSGRVKADGISGTGKIDITSGDIDVSYAEWNGPLDISAISGDIDIELPEGSGINAKVSKVSGSVKADLDDDEVTLKDDELNNVGGANRQNVSVTITSGSVKFSN